MKIKGFILPALIAAATMSSSLLVSMERLYYHTTDGVGGSYTALAGTKLGPVFTPVEDEAAQLLMDLLDDALENDVFYEEQYYESTAGNKKISLRIHPYPATLIHSDYKGRSPQDALERFNSRSRGTFADGDADAAVEDTEDDYSAPSSARKDLRDGSQPLRLQAFASHNQKPCSPLLVYVSMQEWHDLKSLRFLQHPTITTHHLGNLFRECLFNFEVEACGLTCLADIDFRGYRNLTVLNLKNNSIEKLDNALTAATGECPLSSLQELYLDDNLLTSVDNFFESSFKWLEKLSLAQNNIQELPGGCLSGLIMLAYLDLSRNLLRSQGLCADSFKGVGGSSRFFNLRINAEGNILTEFPTLERVKERLIEINLDENPVISAPEDIADCSILRRVSAIKADRALGETSILQAMLQRLCPDGCRIIVYPPQDLSAEDAGYVTP